MEFKSKRPILSPDSSGPATNQSASNLTKPFGKADIMHQINPDLVERKILVYFWSGEGTFRQIVSKYFATSATISRVKFHGLATIDLLNFTRDISISLSRLFDT